MMTMALNPKIFNKYTNIFYQNIASENVPLFFTVRRARDDSLLQSLNFQYGAPTDVGVNGLFDLDLLNIVMFRLKSMNMTSNHSHENTQAIHHLTEVLMWINYRDS